MRVVIDTNVLIAANGGDGGPSPECVAECARRLLESQSQHVILEDNADLVFKEYKNHLSFSGQPGAGDRFFEWFVRTRWTPQYVCRIDIGSNEAQVTAGIPSSCHSFDRSDHKWIAITLQGDGDLIYNALDSDYSISAITLQSEGVSVLELCPTDLKIR